MVKISVHLPLAEVVAKLKPGYHFLDHPVGQRKRWDVMVSITIPLLLSSCWECVTERFLRISRYIIIIIIIIIIFVYWQKCWIYQSLVSCLVLFLAHSNYFLVVNYFIESMLYIYIFYIHIQPNDFPDTYFAAPDVVNQWCTTPQCRPWRVVVSLVWWPARDVPVQQ